MNFTVNNTSINISANDIDSASKILNDVRCNNNFTVQKATQTKGCWYIWNVIHNDVPIASVNGRNDSEASRNAKKLFQYGDLVETDKEFKDLSDNKTDSPKPDFVKPSEIKYVFTIGDSAKTHGFYVFEATCAAEAWNIGTAKFNDNFPQDAGTRLGLWQRVLIPVHANPNWIAADFAKNVKTPSHFAVDVPIGLGLSNEKWTGPRDVVNTNGGVLENAIKKPVDHIAKQG